MPFKTEITNFLKDINDCLLIQGYVSDSLTIPIISYVTESQVDNRKSGKKLSFLVAESFQNIVRHGYDESEENKIAKVKEGFFAMIKTDAEIIICSSNTIENSKVFELETGLKRLAQLDKESLKNEFIEVLSENKTTEGGGAGLGLIEIMRKTNSRLNYSFNPKDDQLSYINFDIFFNENKEIIESSQEIDTNALRDICLNENVLFLRKGLFNHESFIHLSAVLEQKANNETGESSKVLFYIFVELIQNIYKHGLANEEGEVPGLFYVQEYEDHLYFHSQNLSSKENAKNTKERIDKLNSLSSQELLLLYKQRLTEQINFEESRSGDIGLIEILKESKNSLICNIISNSEDSCFLSITVKLNK